MMMVDDKVENRKQEGEMTAHNDSIESVQQVMCVIRLIFVLTIFSLSHSPIKQFPRSVETEIRKSNIIHGLLAILSAITRNINT